MSSSDVVVNNPELKLAEYLREYVKLRSSTVRTLEKYETVLWFNSFPHSQDCCSPVWDEEMSSDEPWLEVKKQDVKPPPSPPASVLLWVDESALKQPMDTIPPLRPTVLLPDETGASGEDSFPIELLLADHPEVRKAYEAFRPKWEAWSRENRQKSRIQKVYSDLFRLHTQIVKQGELIEVVLGLGLLTWNTVLNGNIIPVQRHVVVVNVELEFDTSNGVIRVVPPKDGSRLKIEDDMLEAEFRPDREHYAALQANLEEIGDDIWDGDRLHVALKGWANALCSNSQYNPDLGHQPVPGSNPVVCFAPALILRKRTQTGMLRIYDQMTKLLSDKSGTRSKGWSELVRDTGEHVEVSNADGEAVPGSGQKQQCSEIYFPLPANREQRRIVTTMNSQNGVLVQGPPGTGKSHTIANLICHLLATGKRVLITAETSRALQVLKDKLPEEMKPLCVSLLGQGGDAFQELNTAIQRITTKQASFVPAACLGRIREIERELDQHRRRKAEVEMEIRSLRQDETNRFSIVNGEYSGTPSAIADRVSRERDQYGWLSLSLEADSEPAISGGKVKKWYEIHQKYSAKDLKKASLRAPASHHLPIPVDFANSVDAEQANTVPAEKLEELMQHRSWKPVNEIPFEKLEKLRSLVESLERNRLAIERHSEQWQQLILQDVIAGRPAKWETLIRISQASLEKYDEFSERIGDRVIRLSDDKHLQKMRADASIALSHFRSGGDWSFLSFFTPRNLKGRLYLRDEVIVEGEIASDLEKLQTLCDYLDQQFALSDLRNAWNEAGVPLVSPEQQLSVEIAREQLDILKTGFEFGSLCYKLSQSLAKATPPVPEPDWIAGEAQELLAVVNAVILQKRSKQAIQIAEEISKTIKGLRDLHDTHPVVGKIVDAIEARNVNDYSLCYKELKEKETTQEEVKKREEIEKELLKISPSLVKLYHSTNKDAAWKQRFDAWEKAWSWSIADNWLKKRTDMSYQRKLWANLHREEKKIGQLIGEIASHKAWKHFFERLSQRESEALKGWREAVRAMGKGKGRSAKLARLRNEARSYMNVCRDAIPIWIMPRYLVAEMIDPAPDRYDLVIVDEASQLGIESLFLFYVARKMIVVGDDQQISPYGVGIKDDNIAALQSQYLRGIPHHHALSPQSSLYANAKIRFRQNIVLREHFRCMPEIIQFSNDLCYASNGTPLDPLRTYPPDRLEPLQLRHVKDGYREGGPQNAQNRPEADAITAQVEACIKDPRYRNATMGVISLQGEAQARLIENKLLERVTPEVLRKRRLICGDAYAFQGDERDVIFLSMVAASGETRIGVLSNESARQRFNVAVSRARDQLWLFHTAELDQLSDQCMRYRLLSYMLEPKRQATEEGSLQFDSEFEKEVYRRITERGFHVRTQVCVGDPANHKYRIDLVVEGMQGRLAVECDGDKWHGIDRYEQDMARQRDLERAGWQFVRVRGGDFYRDPDSAMEDVWKELDRLGIKPGSPPKAAASSRKSREVENTDADSRHWDINQKILPVSDNDLEGDSVAESSRNILFRLGEDKDNELCSSTITPEVAATENSDHLQRELLEGKAGERKVIRQVLNSDIIKEKTPYIAFDGFAGPEPAEDNLAQVINGLKKIVEKEGPMQIRRAYYLYLQGCKIYSIRGKCQRLLDKALEQACDRNVLLIEDELEKGDCLYSVVRLAGSPPIVVRERGPRDFNEIPPSEIQVVGRLIAQSKQCNIGEDAHLEAILQYYDLKHLTSPRRSRMREILDHKIRNVTLMMDDVA